MKLTVAAAGRPWVVAMLAATSLFGQEVDKPRTNVVEWFTGNVDLGYRAVTDVAGSLNAYRSLVNLGDGPKLLGADLTITPTKKKLFDRLTLVGIGWGGDPQTTAKIEVSKQRAYKLVFDYRNMAYFDALPSFATPLSGQGIYLNERSYDTRRRMTDVLLELRPGTRIMPYFEYTRSSDKGMGVTNFISDANEYPVANFIDSGSHHYRGGVRVDLNPVHITLEQGFVSFNDQQQLRDSSRVSGNNRFPVLGQTLYLGSLLQAYDVNGSTPYTRGSITASPTKFLDIFGQFQYSNGKTDVNYQESATGSFVDLRTLLFYTSEQNLLAGVARQPHTSGSIGAELRPFRKLRIIENWTTDRLHTDGEVPSTSSLNNRLVDNYNQQSLEVIFDLTSRITLRAGQRYVYGTSSVRAPFAGGFEEGVIQRQAATAGAAYRAGSRFWGVFDFEGGSSDRTYYRTSLQDYRKYRGRVRYQVMSSLQLTWNLWDLENSNPIPTVRYDFTNRINTMALAWAPENGRHWRLTGSYSRTHTESSILYRTPQNYQLTQSLYWQNAHEATATLDVALPSFGWRTGARLMAGGTMFNGTGSRPTEYYRPTARLQIPFNNRLDGFGEWRWYDLSERLYPYEGFRTNTFTVGLRIKR